MRTTKITPKKLHVHMPNLAEQQRESKKKNMIMTNQTTHDLNSRNMAKHMLPPYTADRPVEIKPSIISRQEV